MARRGWFVAIVVFMGAALLGWSVVQARSAPPAGPGAAPPFTPGPCYYTPIAFFMFGSGPSGDFRAFTPVADESYFRFAPDAPITATLASTGTLLVNNSFTGNAGGDIQGPFTMANLTGMAISHSLEQTAALGFQANNLVVSDTQGTLTLLVAYNFSASTVAPPYYPRIFSGTVFSIAATGIYAGAEFVGTIAGTEGAPVDGQVPLRAQVDGRLYAGLANGQGIGLITNGSRGLPPLHAVTLDPADTIAQFYHPDYPAGTTTGNVSPVSVFAGNTSGVYSGTMTLDNGSLVLGNSLTFSPGWIVANLRVSSGADSFYGPWLSDLPGVSVHGYFAQTGGSGLFANSLLFGETSGAIAYQGGEDYAGAVSGTWCHDLQPAGGSATPSPTPAATGLPATATATPAASTATPHLPSATPVPPTGTPGVPSATPPPATATPPPTGTAVSPTATAPPATATPGAPTGTAAAATATAPTGTARPATPPPASATATLPPSTATPACDLAFGDVPLGSPFYTYIHCLSCRGVVSGYADGTFRPGAPVTRGQLVKFLANAAGYADPIPPDRQTFADVPASQPFWLVVERGYAYGLMSGYTCGGPGEPCDAQARPYFRPGVPVTRAQTAKLVAQAAHFADAIPAGQQTFADVPDADPFWVYVERVALHGVIVGYTCGQAPAGPCDAARRPYFLPGAAITRGQTAKFVANSFFPACATASFKF